MLAMRPTFFHFRRYLPWGRRGPLGTVGIAAAVLVILLKTPSFLWAGETGKLSVDFSLERGTIRALNGINKGPLAPGGLVNVTGEQRSLGIPFTRLHDCGWPNLYVVDHHSVFPNPAADPSLPESYDFRLTDEYLDAVASTGAEPVYRLGESIEHTSVKRYTHPPADMAKWTAISLGIIRHCNEGWADGHHRGIRYWEIWNEPENRPAMWSGTDEDYLKLYRTAALAIKKEFPALRVGGPAVGASGQFDEKGAFVPTEFVAKFLTACRDEKLPLNFFSWHCYTGDPAELPARAKAVRQLLDAYGFHKTESHLNEWSYLPGNTWAPVDRTATADARQQFYDEMSGPAGAAFAVTALLELQDAPLDMGNFFHGELGGFGLFSEQGAPRKIWQGFRAFRSLLETPRRVETTGATSGKLALAAGLSPDRRTATLLISNFADPRTEFEIEWKGLGWPNAVTAEIRTVSSSGNFSDIRLEQLRQGNAALSLPLPAPALAVVRLRPAEQTQSQAPGIPPK